MLTARGLQCATNLAIAWGPTMARPRMLDVYHGANGVALSAVQAVMVAVSNLGSSAAPLQSIHLLVVKQGNATAAVEHLAVYQHAPGDAKPKCPALNAYTLPGRLATGAYAGARVVGVRLRPSQERVASKQMLLQVGTVAAGGW